MKSALRLGLVLCFMLVSCIHAQARLGVDDEKGGFLKRDYDEKEKEKWIYYDGNKNISDLELMAREHMWKMDETMVKVRGVFQGYNRGFYKNNSYELNDLCLGRTTLQYAFFIEQESRHCVNTSFGDILSLSFAIYYSVDRFCEIEQWFYDLSTHCFYHDCTPEQLLKNELKAVFQVSGAINALAAVFYDTPPMPDQHMQLFD